jgi:hypothetical protein
MKTKTIKQMYDELNAEVIRKIKAGDFTQKWRRPKSHDRVGKLNNK